MTKTGRVIKCPGCSADIPVPDYFHDHACPICGHTLHDDKPYPHKGGTK